jgi:glycosyltransferase involved in cell wall biosynthesis/SAM-dependent methyltransferase
MRIIIDMQGAQTASRFRGIGRYTTAFTQAVLRNRGRHEIFLALSGLFPETIEPIRDAFKDLLPQDNIRVWHAPPPTPVGECDSDIRMEVAELMFEAFLVSLDPDIVHISSLFEGGFDRSVTSVSNFDCETPVSVILYDLIPMVNPSVYLHPNAQYERFYRRKIESLKRATKCFAISESTRQEAINVLQLSGANIVTIGAAIDGHFKPLDIERSERVRIRTKYQIRDSFVLYAGGADDRKNLFRLIHAYAGLSNNDRTGNQLVFAGHIPDEVVSYLKKVSKDIGLGEDETLFTGYIDDGDLVKLYRLCRLFIFPSWHEGFGLPLLEAMACGAPVLGGNTSSVPEVIGLQEALFDPFDIGAITGKIEQVLQDESFRRRLVEHGLEQAKRFSWEDVAIRAIDAWEDIVRGQALVRVKNIGEVDGARNGRIYEKLIDRLGVIGSRGRGLADSELREIARCIELNENRTPTIDGSRVDEAKQSVGKNDDAVGVRRPNSGAVPKSEKYIGVVVGAEVDAQGVSGEDDGFLRRVPDYFSLNKPYVFSSTLCRENHFHLPLYTYWCRVLKELPRFHRKQWEFAYICQTLFERGYLREGMSAIGFGVGREPLVSYFASRGMKVTATDLDFEKAKELGWSSTDQHSRSLEGLNERGLCGDGRFYENVRFEVVNMNEIPVDIGTFDVCWSACALEHLGSIRRGLDFVKSSARLLKPGGIAVHTTEYNLSSNESTLDNNEAFVIFRRKDIELLEKELVAEGFAVEAIDFSAGNDRLERYVDLPPYKDEPHLRLELAGEFISTSIGLIVRVPMGREE